MTDDEARAWDEAVLEVKVIRDRQRHKGELIGAEFHAYMREMRARDDDLCQRVWVVLGDFTHRTGNFDELDAHAERIQAKRRPTLQ
jgi:hypothetical protein